MVPKTWKSFPREALDFSDFSNNWELSFGHFIAMLLIVLCDILRIRLVFMVLCVKPMSLLLKNGEEARDKICYLMFDSDRGRTSSTPNLISWVSLVFQF